MREVLACCGDDIAAVVDVVVGDDGVHRLIAVRGF
jgi:hypothetical protein